MEQIDQGGSWSIARVWSTRARRTSRGSGRRRNRRRRDKSRRISKGTELVHVEESNGGSRGEGESGPVDQDGGVVMAIGNAAREEVSDMAGRADSTFLGAVGATELEGVGQRGNTGNVRGLGGAEGEMSSNLREQQLDDIGAEIGLVGSREQVVNVDKSIRKGVVHVVLGGRISRMDEETDEHVRETVPVASEGHGGTSGGSKG